jgi:AcrR family transcriptional regulator
MPTERRPYRSPQRDAAAAQTRERLVAAARELLAGDAGLNAFSLDAVARQAGVSRPTVYNQFGSRRALLEAVFDDIAVQGGITRLPSVMSEPDPKRALQRLVELFCAFFAYAGPAMGPLIAAAEADPELRESLRERHERRRRAIGVLVQRLREQGEVAPEAAQDLVDLLHALTGPAVLFELTGRGRSAEAACVLLQQQVADAVARAAPPKRAGRRRTPP